MTQVKFLTCFPSNPKAIHNTLPWEADLTEYSVGTAIAGTAVAPLSPPF